MSEILRVEGLKKGYMNVGNRIEVLKGVDLKVNERDILLIFGPSGSGKTTLLNLIGLLDSPDDGKIILFNEDILNKNEEEKAILRNRRIGFVFQFHYLFPEFTAIENIILPGLIKGEKRDVLIKKAEKLMDEFLLIERKDFYPHQLSGGEQQRVAVLRAIFNDPDLILCDEPTGDLDEENRSRVIGMLKMLNEKGKTVIIVSHNIIFSEIANRIMYLKDGRLIEGG
ncbi:MAG: hypothetical protein DRI36_00165 [Caldiserica bacterium]|nr:MAG: hypothetical protein DRI36_00165 [Caldisericota bacterium]